MDPGVIERMKDKYEEQVGGLGGTSRSWELRRSEGWASEEDPLSEADGSTGGV